MTTADPSEDAEVLRGYRRGDPDVLERIFRAFVDPVAVLVRRGFTIDRGKLAQVPGVLDPEEQDDLIQETFVRVFSEQARTGYRETFPFRPYLLRITKNLMIDRLRRGNRRVGGPTANTVGEINAILERNAAFEPEDPAVELERRRLLTATDAYVRTLEGPERRLFELRYQQGMSQQHVAAQMNVTRRRVRTLERRVHRGLLALLRKEKLLP